jgi:hypothetical protein
MDATVVSRREMPRLGVIPVMSPLPRTPKEPPCLKFLCPLHKPAPSSISTLERATNKLVLVNKLFAESIYMIRNLATIGACAIILLGSAAVSANAKAGGGGGGATFGAAGHGGSANGHAGSTSSNSNNVGGHGGPVGFATGQFAPSGTPLCQPGVCPGRSQ